MLFMWQASMMFERGDLVNERPRLSII